MNPKTKICCCISNKNVNEPTHSTQFSFDESLIKPDLLLSPTLSNRSSNSKAKANSDDDVVEAISIMKQGCFMMILKVNPSINNNKTLLPIEWNICNISSQKDSICCINHKTPKILLKNISKVSILHRDSSLSVQSILNLSGIEQIGLQSVTLRLTMNDASKSIYYLIFDEYRNAFIWNRGLRTLLEMNKISQPISTIAMVCSNIDRINNTEMHSKMSVNNNNDDTFKWINHIANKISSIRVHVHRLNIFAKHSCILDSSSHLSLLIQSNSLKEMLVDLNKLISIPYSQLTQNEIISLREVWLSLLADLTVALLKEHQLKNDMALSRQIKPNILNLSK